MDTESEKKLTKAEQAAMRRNQIIDTALKLFSEKGFGNTTIKDISEAAGTSLGLMYHYFAGKDELLVAVFEKHSFLEPLRKTLTIKGNKPVRDVLYEIALKFYKLLISRRELVNIVLNEMRINPSFNKAWSAIGRRNQADKRISRANNAARKSETSQHRYCCTYRDVHGDYAFYISRFFPRQQSHNRTIP